MTTRWRLLASALAVAASALACGGGSSTSSSSASSSTQARPTTTAQLRITAPEPNAVVDGPTVQVTMELVGAKIVPQTSGPLRPDEGHVHISLDGRVVAMSFQATDQLTNVAPGQHSIQAEFVAADHAPFANRVKSAVLFTVR